MRNKKTCLLHVLTLRGPKRLTHCQGYFFIRPKISMGAFYVIYCLSPHSSPHILISPWQQAGPRPLKTSLDLGPRIPGEQSQPATTWSPFLSLSLHFLLCFLVGPFILGADVPSSQWRPMVTQPTELYSNFACPKTECKVFKVTMTQCVVPCLQ